MNIFKWALDFFYFDDDAIRFFVYGGTGAVVKGVADEKKKSFWGFAGLAFVGATCAAFGTPSIIQYYDIQNIKYQMCLGFVMGITSMITVSKILSFAKLIKVKVPNIELGAKGGDGDGSNS